MRQELRDIIESGGNLENDYWVYGLDKHDLDYTFSMVKEFEKYQSENLDKVIADAKERYPDPDTHVEIIDDAAYYAWIRIQYLWHFCLWRMQGVLEGLIKYSFLPQPQPQLGGLKRKLDAMKSAGYTMTQDDYDDLINWGRLRNALSHAPPEQYRLGFFLEPHVIEYKDLIERLCDIWTSEKPGITKH